MHIDLTPEEVRHIMEVVGAGDNTKDVVMSILSKMSAVIANLNPVSQEIDSDHVRNMAHKWKSPI